MATATDATRHDLEAALEAGGQGFDPDLRGDFARFTRAFLAGIDARVLRTRGAEALVALSREAFDAVRTPRRAGERRVRVYAPDDRPGRSVLEALQDDRPFLVDTIRLALRRRGLTEQLLLHPILAVERDEAGRLVGLGGRARARGESFIYAEFYPRLPDAAAHESFEAELADDLSIVADVTDDHAAMVKAVRELAANVERAGRHAEVGAERAGKITRFLEWLLDRHFVLMGVRSYDVEPGPDGPAVRLRPGSGLGTWRRPETSRFAESRRGAELPDEIARVLADPRIVQVGKARAESRIHRAGRLDRVLVKEHDAGGRVVGFVLFAGLFTFRALRTPASEVPLLAERLEQILAEEAASPGSHRHKALVAAFDAAPVEFLLATDVESNAALIREVVDAEGSDDARLVLREDPDGRSFYAAVILPRERYSEALRARIRELLEERAGAAFVDDRAAIGEDGSAVLHYFCTRALDGSAPLERDALEGEVVRLAARWEDRLLDALVERFGEARGVALAGRYGPAFPEALRVTTHPEDAVRDVAGLEAVQSEGDPQFALYFDRGAADRETATLRIYLARPWLLSDLLPAVDHFGIRVVDARQTRIAPAERPAAVIATLRILPLGGDQTDLDALAPRLSDALGAALRGVVPDDPLNGLVLQAGLDWREVDLVRAYIEYFNQIQGTLTRPFVRSVLLDNPLAVRLLVKLHEARLAPGLEDDARAESEARLRRAFQQYRDRIPSLNEDRALGALYELIDATLRTSFWRPREGAWRVSFKLDPRRIAELRPPKPWREIFVHAADVDGIHLRGGPVARGGLRWSDRLEDFRTEVLGLMRTQMLKNGLIVPVGAKGGFVLKRPGLAPNEARAEADRQYRVFVSGLLDLTDNRDADGRVVPPPGIVRRDGDDPYLVVAADKGTAHLSDAANELALARDFWLGDAFASGGSEGYDHKKYGITARGAFECVKLHFAELGVDPERDTYTVAGIGDMSGDVFGNGLLLMRRGKLVAAFDHRHVFLDPDPDPEVAWRERRRLFELPASSWADYDPKCLSPGGGVWPRGAKRIPLEPRARERLGLARDFATGQELVRAILAMPVDLFWNGGIGTYVKASSETHADVGDRGNDAVR
ncbi:MAG TPA: NAD-glutamate dehydrogenase domain-containing protein, partial [Myxococcota bacterium]|nr:NAD-glutamate dehydrogenase domain-containing protein [Myxococcota bacterium]